MTGDEGDERDERVVLPADVVERYPRFSLYNSPYPAHDRGRAIDLYPEGDVGLSPVAGEVLDTRTVGCPDRPYAVDSDHLILVDVGARVARVLHVDPAVEAGDRVAVGDPLGETVRSGFFGRWVDDHVHLEFREYGRNPYRASGSLPLDVDVPVRPVEWDGTGTVSETGDSYALLDSPAHHGDGYAALASDAGAPLDGGLPHYSAGGRFVDGSVHGSDFGFVGEAPVGLLGARVGTAAGRHVGWGEVTVLANGEPITGLSLFASRVEGFGAKLVTRPAAGDPQFRVGEDVRVSIRPTDGAVRLD
ncbi:hypothetical protein [Halorarum salinum]|uniref:M23 family metallopeptidase n=1 Tax=Halorarum salinum TaxID=2743089 RepID=A0A7D5QAA3_9EURY|nr:hypothetical protein [Halobaculum salinum]QLG60780.1 hypothetical protein HUG12_03070 [Halobaculum salinum]